MASPQQEQRRQGAGGFHRLDVDHRHVMRLLDACGERKAWPKPSGWPGQWTIIFVGSYSTEWLIVAHAALTAARKLGDRRDEGAFLNKLGLASSGLGQLPQNHQLL